MQQLFLYTSSKIRHSNQLSRNINPSILHQAPYLHTTTIASAIPFARYWHKTDTRSSMLIAIKMVTLQMATAQKATICYKRPCT